MRKVQRALRGLFVIAVLAGLLLATTACASRGGCGGCPGAGTCGCAPDRNCCEGCRQGTGCICPR